MTRRWLIAAASAGALSLALHGTVLIALAPAEPQAQALAGGSTQLAMIGNSFEDAVAGKLSSQSDFEPAEVPEISAVSAERETPAPSIIPDAAPVAAVPPIPSVTVSTVQAPQALPVIPGDAAIRPALPDSSSSAATSMATFPSNASSATPPIPAPSPTATAARAPIERVQARDAPVVQTPGADTPRPQQRIARPAPSQRSTPAAPAPPVPQGSATETTRAGHADGAQPGRATRSQQGGAGQAAASDGRAAARYPEEVLRRFNRIRRPDTRFRGAAVIAFSVASNGGLSEAYVARSSGDAGFDQLAIAYIERAAPFPPPPAGAQRNFNVTVRGR